MIDSNRYSAGIFIVAYCPSPKDMVYVFASQDCVPLTVAVYATAVPAATVVVVAVICSSLLPGANSKYSGVYTSDDGRYNASRVHCAPTGV